MNELILGKNLWALFVNVFLGHFFMKPQMSQHMLLNVLDMSVLCVTAYWNSSLVFNTIHISILHWWKVGPIKKNQYLLRSRKMSFLLGWSFWLEGVNVVSTWVEDMVYTFTLLTNLLHTACLHCTLGVEILMGL